MTTILLVEDNKNQRLLYEQELSSEGYEVIIAANGKEALEKVQDRQTDLIIMDILMPKMDGIEAMGKILSKRKDIPIIINTSYNNHKDNFMTWAADAYIVKSADLTELKSKIKETLTTGAKARTNSTPILFDSSTVEHTKLSSSTATTGNAANSTLKE